MHDFWPEMKGAVGLFGGSFNPVHAGHIRLAVEAREALQLERVLFIPAANPPHKPCNSLLPFALRFSLLQTALQAISGLELSSIESERTGLSYSYDTIRVLRAQYPETVFILGSGDFLTLLDWHRGQELPYETNILVVDRDGLSRDALWTFLEKHWSLTIRCQNFCQIEDGKKLGFLSIPRLDISSSLVRSRFLAGREIRGFVGKKEYTLLEENTALCRQIWTAYPESSPGR